MGEMSSHGGSAAGQASGDITASKLLMLLVHWGPVLEGGSRSTRG